MGHHRIRGRVHRIYGPRLGGTLGYRKVGRCVGSIGYIIAHADIGWIGPVRLCQYVEEQTGQVLEGDPGPTTMKHVTHLRRDNTSLRSVNSTKRSIAVFDVHFSLQRLNGHRNYTSLPGSFTKHL